MPRKPRWYDPVPEATAVVTCGGEGHRVTWRRGKLVLEAHDLTAERTMLAFGGELCECMRVLGMWVEQFRMPPELFFQVRASFGADAHLAPPEFDLQRRLAMIAGWERSWRAESYVDDKQARLLGAELKDKALGPLRQHLNAWKPRTGARVVSGCAVRVVPAGEPATAGGTCDGVAMRAAASLHGRWLIDVWPRGVATVDEAFVLQLEKARTADDLQVVASRWEPASAGTWASVDRPARLWRHPGAVDWHLEWEGS